MAHAPTSRLNRPESAWLNLELQCTPTRSASTELKEAVDRAFQERGLHVDRWTVPRGEDRELPTGMKWAEPTLDVRALAQDQPLETALTQLPLALGDALAHLRQTYPALGLGLRVVGQDRTLWLAVRRADAAETWLTAFQALQTGELRLGTGDAYGWDAGDNRWIPI